MADAISTAARRNSPFALISSNGLEEYPEFQHHRCVFMASVMIQFHNILIRALNSAYQHAEGIESGSQDAVDLFTYSRFICELIGAHHDWEEKNYFPALETFAGQPGILESNIEQHHAFEEGLREFHEYCKQSKENFSAVKFRALIDAFATSFGKHLHEEPLSFYRLRHLDSDGLVKIYFEQEKIAIAQADPWV